MRRRLFVLIILTLIGIIDAGYLTYEYYVRVIPPCSVNGFFSDCGKVLQNRYAVFWQIPLALWGLMHYVFFLIVTILAFWRQQKKWLILLTFLATIGLLISAYLVYLQIFVIKAICFYCLISALNSGLLFIIVSSGWFRLSGKKFHHIS